MLTTRYADTADLDTLVDLMIADARLRQTSEPGLWKVADNAADKVRSTIKAAMENTAPPFRQTWMLAETDGAVVGASHSILLPVPPIYAGELGAPGLIMEDCFVSAAAPKGTAQVLLDAVERDLIDAGARIVLGSSVANGPWSMEFTARGYEPLTLYLAKVGLNVSGPIDRVRKAINDDVPGIVASSAENRQILCDLDPFWKPHDDADSRFGAWMEKSLSLTDRDMFVMPAAGGLTGYAISHPATPLHFPTPHDIGGIGVIDDFYHADLCDPGHLHNDGVGATAVFTAAESALAQRGNTAALVVCPARWTSKAAMLETLGYKTAITWFIKR